MYKSTNFLRKVYSLLLITTVLSGALPVFAQKKATQTTQSNKSQQKCSGAWTGTVTYSRYQSMTDSQTTKRVSNRGEDKRNWEMKYDYKANVVVQEDPAKNGNSTAKANITHTFTSIDKTSAVEKNSCDQGKTWKEMTGDFSTKTETNGEGKGVETNVHVGVNADGSYTVSVALPQIKGKTTGEQKSSFSGQCKPKKGETQTMQPTETTIEGNSLTSDGKDRVDIQNPTKLSGSFTKTWENVTETITWNLQKCGAPLRITDLKFEHMKFPNWNDWQEISEASGTTDGNWVRIKAKVLNLSGETKFGEVYIKETWKGDKYNGSRPDVPLKDQTFSVRLEAGEEREVEMLWDTSGYAWFEDGRARSHQNIKAEVWENYQKQDELTKYMKVTPKPVVLVHGLWSNWKAWELWQNRMTLIHSYDWRAYPVGERPEKGIMNTGGGFMSTDPTNSIEENAIQLEKYVKYAREERNAWHVDIVGHSMGGLIARYYIAKLMEPDAGDYRPPVSHLIMLGTPNEGSSCAVMMTGAFDLLGKKVEAVRQLNPEVVQKFNRTTMNWKGVKFSALAGNPLPVMCKELVANDGVVTVPSAKWIVKDTAESKDTHTDLTSAENFMSFVKPRLAIGPKGDHNPGVMIPQMPNQTGANRQNEFGAVFMNAAYRDESPAAETILDADFYKPDFAKAVKLAPKQSVEIEIPVEAAQNFGLTFMADASISATLVDDKGAVAGKNLTKTPEANGWFRSIFVNKAVNAGTWKLKLENTSDREFEAIIAAWGNAGK